MILDNYDKVQSFSSELHNIRRWESDFLSSISSIIEEWLMWNWKVDFEKIAENLLTFYNSLDEDIKEFFDKIHNLALDIIDNKFNSRIPEILWE